MNKHIYVCLFVRPFDLLTYMCLFIRPFDLLTYMCLFIRPFDLLTYVCLFIRAFDLLTYVFLFRSITLGYSLDASNSTFQSSTCFIYNSVLEIERIRFHGNSETNKPQGIRIFSDHCISKETHDITLTQMSFSYCRILLFIKSLFLLHRLTVRPQH